MRFRFRLQRLLDLRERHEQALARDLASAQDQADEERRGEDALRQARDLAQQRLSRDPIDTPTMGTLLMLTHAFDRMDEHAAAASERTQAADLVVEERHQALTVAAQARRMLDRLRSRREAAFRDVASANDLRSMDAIAISRFLQEDRLSVSPTNRTTP